MILHARRGMMKRVTSRELNQDVSRAKRFALVEPVFVTDRGRPTHVLISIDAWRQLSGERENMAQLLAAPPGEAALDRKSTRLNPVTNAQLVCRLLLENTKKMTTQNNNN